LGLTAATLYQWRRRLANPPPDAGQPCSSGLIQVSLARDASSGEPPSFVVHLAGNRCVEIPVDFDGEALQRLVSVLETC
jgi:hypothetical protein